MCDMKYFFSNSWILTSAVVLSGGVLIHKFIYFSKGLHRSRFIKTLHFSFLECFITTVCTCCLKYTRFLGISEKYQIMCFLVSTFCSIRYRYELFCCRSDYFNLKLFWKSHYPWIMYCAAPSLFICGFKKSIHLFALQQTITFGMLGISIGVLLPNKTFMKDLAFIFPGIGLGLFVAKIFLIFVSNASAIEILHPYVDLFHLGLILTVFGFLIEDVRTLKEKAVKMLEEEYFDELSLSVPLHIDFVLLFLFMNQFIEPFFMLRELSL